MTPKEKAQELFHKFWDCDDIKSFELANQCALIAVDEILSILFQHHEIDYWKEVKLEIERL